MAHPRNMRFHRKCGERVTLLNDSKTAVRNFVDNHGLVLSADPLKDDIMFEVCVDRKVHIWTGNLEIGVTTLDPEYLDIPGGATATATKLRNTAWILSGSSVMKDGVNLVNNYAPELDNLREGDCLGVLRTHKGELMFYINGRCLGIAAKDLPSRVFAVIGLFGQCVQVSIMNNVAMRPIMEVSLDQIDEDPNNDDTLTSESEMDVAGAMPLTPYNKPANEVYVPMTSEAACAMVAQDRLRFHPRSGILVKLSNNNKSAERARPLDDYNNGVVMSHRPLYEEELFEIRIDRLVDKWSGSIEVGVTTHNPTAVRFPSTMTNMDSGTIMMSGCKVLVNGQGTCMEYGNFNLDELREGDTVGMMRKRNGSLHYFINGVDQGAATEKVDPVVWAVVDLYGMTVKVTIVDPCEDVDSNIQQAPIIDPVPDTPTPSFFGGRIEEDSLLFHTLRDSNVIIINDGKTAHRPNAFEFFNNGIVMTNRSLKTNELFQVRLDLVIHKWAGSIEIGVTQHTCNEITLPFKMSNAKSGTWAMTGEDVIRDGNIVIPQYVRNLNRLVEGDTVGVMRKDNGILHFFVNGVDQGPAAFNIPEHVFGIVDLYGRVAQATIVDSYLPPPCYTPESPMSSESNATIYPEMCFHRMHGRNARLSRNRLTASRSAVYSEFNDAVLFSSRPLRECEMFELRIDKMVDCWIGSLEIGVTAIKPDDLEASGGVGAVAGTATDLSWDTYILSGSAMMKDGECVRSGYPLDLDSTSIGSRVGMMWHADRSLHYYLDGMDQGKAWYVPHLNIYAVIDLYGQCTQVTILQNDERMFNYNGCTNSDNSFLSIPRNYLSPPPPYCFSEYCGENVCLMHDYSFAKRMTSDPAAALTFSAGHLALNEMFEIKIIECKSGFAGGLRMGVTDVNILNAHVNRNMPPGATFLPHFTAFIDGKSIKYTRPGPRVHESRSFVPSFEWLRPGDRIGLKKTTDRRVLVFYNSELLDVCIENVPDKVYVVMELFGNVTKIQAISKLLNIQTSVPQPVMNNGSEFSKMAEHSSSSAFANGTCSVIAAALAASSLFGVAPALTSLPEIEYKGDPLAEGTTSGEVTTVIDGPSTSRASSEGASTSAIDPSVETRRRRHPLPYTFHYVHGANIKLCSSDTVAVRTSGYKDGIAIVSQPLRRGHNFRFRVDKVCGDWSGSVAIGAVGSLPSCDQLPQSALTLEPPCWLVSSELLNDNGHYDCPYSIQGDFLIIVQIHTGGLTDSRFGPDLDEIGEQAVLMIHFRFNSELVLQLDDKVLGSIASVPRTHNFVYPVIDLYGQVCQVSVLIHPYIVGRGSSVDLPIINENTEDSQAEQEESEFDEDELIQAISHRPRNRTLDDNTTKKVKAYSQDNLYGEAAQMILAGTSNSPTPRQREIDAKAKDLKNRRLFITKLSLHQSLIMRQDYTLQLENADNDEVNRSIQKSHSTHNFSHYSDDSLESDFNDCFRRTFAVGDVDDEEDFNIQPRFCDTNIQHNDRYPEANDVDNLDNEIMNALTLDPGTLPDLTEEQSSSIDDSTRNEFDPEPSSMENLRYLHRLLTHSAELEEAESAWRATGEGCEHLHLVLKFWSFIVMPYPELRQAVTNWGQVRCYCVNCKPEGDAQYAGWVRIERTRGTLPTRRRFWHVDRSTVAFTQAGAVEPGPVYRPGTFALAPYSTSTCDIWFDEEGKPHHTVVALEIETEAEATQDRLIAFLIFLKCHANFNDSNPPSSLD